MPLTVVIIIIAAIVALAAYALHGIHRRNSADTARIRGAFEAAGLHYEAKGDAEFASAWSVVPGLTKRGTVHHVAFGDYRELPVTAFRHRYIVHTGQGAAVILHWVFATDTPQWPSIHLRRRSWMARAVGLRSRVTDDAAFNRMWAVKTKDPKFAEELLSPAVRALLMPLNTEFSRWSTPQWHFVGGKVCFVVRGGGLKAMKFEAALDHVVDMWNALNPA